MAQEHETSVRRAQVSDAATIATFVNQARRERTGVSEQMVIDRLGSVGFMLAEQDSQIVGLLGWQAENLVARVTDLLILPASERLNAGLALFSRMEQAAKDLQCEAALLHLPQPAPTELVEFCETFGYGLQAVKDLPRAWREAAHEAGLEDSSGALVKRLRTDRVLRPL